MSPARAIDRVRSVNATPAIVGTMAGAGVGEAVRVAQFELGLDVEGLQLSEAVPSGIAGH